KRSIAIAEQHAEISVCIVGSGNVQLAIAVEVPDRHAERMGPGDEELRLRERPIPVAERHADEVCAPDSRNHVGLAIAVEITNAHADGVVSQSKFGVRWEEAGEGAGG